MNYTGVATPSYLGSKAKTSSSNSTIQWTAIENSQSRVKNSYKHVSLVAYKPAGMGLNTVYAVAPLYDLRDLNLDGSASLAEKFWYDPYEVFELIQTAGEASFIADAATQLRDYKLFNSAMAGLLKATHKASAKALTTIMVEKVLSPGIELNMANTALAELGKVSEVVQFVVQTALETVIIESICATRK
jgi:hypothetical protein